MTKVRLVLAWALLITSLVGWPVSLFLFTSEPPLVLSLSWLALILTSWDIIQTTSARKGIEEGT